MSLQSELEQGAVDLQGRIDRAWLIAVSERNRLGDALQGFRSAVASMIEVEEDSAEQPEPESAPEAPAERAAARKPSGGKQPQA